MFIVYYSICMYLCVFVCVSVSVSVLRIGIKGVRSSLANPIENIAHISFCIGAKAKQVFQVKFNKIQKTEHLSIIYL